jgi:superfamily II RNA helicase
MLHVKTGEYKEPMQSVALVFPYEPDHFQKHAFAAIEAGHNVLVTAHTGSGKTSVADYAVARAVRDGSRVIYTAPIKALSNQIYADLKRKYPEWDVGIKTGDIDLKSDSQIVIMTTEILRNYLFKSAEQLVGVQTVIFDEVHYIKDKDRGSVWEESIIMMPQDIQMILLSATLPDAEEFCQWIINCKGGSRDVTYCTTERRVVPLTHYIMTGETKKIKILDNDGTFYPDDYARGLQDYRFDPRQLNSYIGAGGIDLPALFFCFSRNKCEQYARAIHVPLIDSGEMSAIDRDFSQLIRKFDPGYEFTKQAQDIKKLLLKGVAYHHAGLLPALKEIVQELFTRGMVKVLFVTETFAAGVNAPAKTVVFTGLTKFDGYTNDFRPLYPEEYRQMAGRAGRRGLDTIGTVIMLPFKRGDLLPLHEIKPMLTGAIRNIESNFKLDFSYILKCINSGYEPDKYLETSLLRRQENSRADFYYQIVDEMDAKREKLEQEYESFSERTISRAETVFKYKNRLLSPKDIKIYHLNSKTEEWDKDKDLQKAIRVREKMNSVDAEMNMNTQMAEDMRYSVYSEIQSQIEELKQQGYLDGEGKLTKLGLAFIEINETDPNIVINCITRGLFDRMTKFELLSSLALFATDGKGSDNEASADPMERPDFTEEHIRTITTPIVQFADQEFGVELSREFCVPVWNWVWHGSFTEGVSEGEFVKACLKVLHITEEVSAAALILERLDICKLLEDSKLLIVHHIVTPQSLYV